MQQVQRRMTQKGKTPKVRISCGFGLGHMIKSHMTVIWKQMGRYREDMSRVLSASAYHAGGFCVRRKLHGKGGKYVNFYRCRCSNCYTHET